MKTDPRVDHYIGAFPPETQVVLRSLRALVAEVLPRAEESISYGIPVYRIDSVDVVFIAGWKRHVSVYPVPRGDEAVERQLEPYRAGKGTLRFDLETPLPLELIRAAVTLLARPRGEREPEPKDRLA